MSTVSNIASINGQLLTIYGKGFSSVNSENVVKVQDNVCKVLKSSFESITCEMPAFADPGKIQYVGVRGLRWRMWNKTHSMPTSRIGSNVKPDLDENMLTPDGPYRYYVT